ncbi:MAG: hypothetical protein V4608_07495 [Bacteroidota bacterium]
MKKTIAICLLIPVMSSAQGKLKLDPESGQFQLGIRNTISSFSDDAATGFGVGGQFRIRVTKQINTDWFADQITTDISGIARRVDHHIGWSVVAYPFNSDLTKGKVTPYILAGHCFDHTTVSKNGTTNTPVQRRNSAVQVGMGMHYNITDRVDLSLTGQYMMHLGYNIHTTVIEVDGKKDVLIEKTKAKGVEGHLLINLSLNVRICDLLG